MAQKCEFYWLGLVPYKQVWQLQEKLAAEIGLGQRPPTLLLLEHPHTYTFGRSGQIENLLWDEAELERRNISVHWVDRGGDVTYHGPGQLVGYPLLTLAPGGLLGSTPETRRLPQADYVGYVRRLESMLILALARLGVCGERVPGKTGIWVRTEGHSGGTNQDPALQPAPAKIAAIGVKVDVNGISRHGFALNINPNMQYWEGIVGCGLHGARTASLVEYIDPTPSIEVVKEEVVIALGETFGYEMVDRSHEGKVILNLFGPN